jgi:putative membrane protein
MKKELALRDKLAQKRTQLANERTLLAYWRTSVAFLGLGVIMIKFFPSIEFMVTGTISMIFGAGLFVYSIKKFRFPKERINKNN